MDQYEQIQSYNKKFFWGVAVKLSLAALVVLIVAGAAGLTWYYRDLDERKIGLEDAKKIGNWELIDDYFVFQGAYKLKMFNDMAKNVEILDEKNGNEINILAMSKGFSDAHLRYDPTKSEDNKSNDEIFMEFYVADSYAVRGTGKIEDGSAEVNYNMIENKGYQSLNDKISGFLGKIDCTDSVIVILITNKADKFNSERAYDFVRRMSCGGSLPSVNGQEESGNVPDGDAEDPADTGAGENGDTSSTGMDAGNVAPQPEPSLPVENKVIKGEDNDGDGLSNNVEYVVGSDPNKADTDLDGYNDFSEIKYGHDPIIASPGDVFYPNDYKKLKERIKIIDEENYNRLFR